MLPTSQRMIKEPDDGMTSTASHDVTPLWNMHHVERAMMNSFQDAYSKKEIKDIFWLWKQKTVGVEILFQ